jgi:hypothetical protein
VESEKQGAIRDTKRFRANASQTKLQICTTGAINLTGSDIGNGVVVDPDSAIDSLSWELGRAGR